MKPSRTTGADFLVPEIQLHQISLRMPVSLFEEISKQAAERGLPVTGYIRTQLAASIRNPTNIHATTKENTHAT